MSNMRQVGQALHIYANENQGWLIAAQNSYDLPRPGGATAIAVWVRQLRYSEFQAKDPISVTPVLLCPEDNEHIATNNFTNYMYCRTYGFWNTATNAWTNAGTVYLPRKLQQFQK